MTTECHLSRGRLLWNKYYCAIIRAMQTVTLPRIKYETLRRKASLYEEVFQDVKDRVFKTESYSDKRVKEFFKEDKLHKDTAKKLEKLLNSK